MKTIKEKLAQFDGLEKAYDVQSIALADYVKGKAHRIGTGDGFTLWITRHKGASGGVAIVNDGGNVMAHYFEEAFHTQMRRFDLCLTGENNELNRSLLVRRTLWEKAKAFVNSAV